MHLQIQSCSMHPRIQSCSMHQRIQSRFMHHAPIYTFTFYASRITYKITSHPSHTTYPRAQVSTNACPRASTPMEIIVREAREKLAKCPFRMLSLFEPNLHLIYCLAEIPCIVRS
ncbi:hypothetical protein LOAG_05035 [Loa loa]|uniref:Ovule protein n=1 Tax=Loa loa TaxID=7209 RepID=A0A1I7V9V5_LOALO|nr:hypothetical protein LOAG_05035 [Loa loa]EFO23453.2 hypothetical protein LOAG_05035 [Loa loa]